MDQLEEEVGEYFSFEEDDHDHPCDSASEVGRMVKTSVALVGCPGRIEKITNACYDGRDRDDEKQVKDRPGLEEYKDENDSAHCS